MTYLALPCLIMGLYMGGCHSDTTLSLSYQECREKCMSNLTECSFVKYNFKESECRIAHVPNGMLRVLITYLVKYSLKPIIPVILATQCVNVYFL